MKANSRVFTVLILSLLLSASAATAQGGSIANIISSRSDLSIFAEFVNAADPGVRQSLQRGGNWTVFAPNDTAFRNLESLIDAPLRDVLRDPVIVTQLVQYHILAGESSSTQLARLSGQVIPTALGGAFVSMRVAEDNTIIVNNVVEIVTPNIDASNGVVHIVNDVLLNRLIASALDNPTISAVITPNTGALTSTPVPPPTGTPQPDEAVTADTAVASQLAHVRIANLVSDLDAVDIYIDDDPLFERIERETIGDFAGLAPDTYRVTVVSANDDPENPLLGPLPIQLEAGSFNTIIVFTTVDGSTEMRTLGDDVATMPRNRARVAVANVLTGLPSVDLVVDSLTDSGTLLFGDLLTIDVERGRFTPEIYETDSDNEIVNIRPGIVDEGAYQLLIVAGSVETPINVSVTIDAESLAALKASDVSAMSSSDTVNVGVEEQTILDDLRGSGEFSILLAALEAADEEVMGILDASTDEAITFLAPTDRAFRNLLATIGYSQGQLLAERALLTEILLYHTVEGEFSSSDFEAAAGTSVQTMLQPGQAFFVTVTRNGTIILNGVVGFEQKDITLANGIMHVVDEVLLPQGVLDLFGL